MMRTKTKMRKIQMKKMKSKSNNRGRNMDIFYVPSLGCSGNLIKEVVCYG